MLNDCFFFFEVFIEHCLLNIDYCLLNIAYYLFKVLSW
jgi:hypothetical protein